MILQNQWLIYIMKLVSLWLMCFSIFLVTKGETFSPEVRAALIAG